MHVTAEKAMEGSKIKVDADAGLGEVGSGNGTRGRVAQKELVLRKHGCCCVTANQDGGRQGIMWHIMALRKVSLFNIKF